MDIFVYSDESGVFDNMHNDIYVFGGLILLGKDSKDIWSRRYIHAENTIRPRYGTEVELKASTISNADKHKLMRSLNNCRKFGIIIQQAQVHGQIFTNKKDKQRYLDFAYKIGLRRALENLLDEGEIDDAGAEFLRVFVDEHTSATSGRYELREALEQEFKNGTYNWNYGIYFNPVFTKLKSVELGYKNSEKTTLIRAADIVANSLYHEAIHSSPNVPKSRKNFTITIMPE